jgi:hypothetical protein
MSPEQIILASQKMVKTVKTVILPPPMNLLEMSKSMLAEVLAAGDVAVDATVGNGRDTLFLAEAVGPTGIVHGFDVQEAALGSASSYLAEHAVDNTRLHHAGHEKLFDYVPEEDLLRLKAVMFNLGWLPGGDKSIVTQPETTLHALGELTRRMHSGSVISIVVYTGHPGGGREGEAVLGFCKALPFQEWTVFRAEYLNKSGKEIFLLLSKR